MAALGSADQTAVVITLLFPTKFLYLPKRVNIYFESDDTTTEFEQFGVLAYEDSTASVRHTYELASSGVGRFTALLAATNIYHPIGAWREWINAEAQGASNNIDRMTLNIQDMSGDTSTAGDVFWNVDFWIYDLEQCMNYPVNLFEQLIPYP